MNWFRRAQENKGQPQYEVRRDGRLLYIGSEAECWHYIHKHTSSSVDWAKKHEGWTITPRHEDWRDSYEWYGGE